MTNKAFDNSSQPAIGDLVGHALNACLVILVLLASALAMSPSIADPDLWGHVQFGRDVLANGQVAETTTYSFTANGFRWINHENLSEIAMASLVNQFGPAGLLWAKFLMSLLVIGIIIWFNLKQQISLLATAVIALLVAWNLGYHWSFRPQLSSLFLFTLMVLLLQYCFSGWRDQWNLPRWSGLHNPCSKVQIKQTWLQGRMLWLLVPLMLVWTNSHGGFVAGLCIALAYLGLRAIEAVCTKRGESWGLVRRLILIGSAMALTTLINPYSFRLPLWLMESLGQPRPEIVDWSNGQLFTVVGLKFWALLIVVLFALFRSRHSHDFVQVALLAITLWQALSHFRHVPFFAILCGFWLGPHLHSALLPLISNSSVRENEQSTWPRWLAVGMVMLLIVGVSVRLSDRLGQLKVDRSVYPVDAFSFLQEHNIHGRMVVTYNWAQYAIAARCAAEDAQRSRVAFDGRYRTCYPQEIVDMHFDFLYGDQQVMERYRSPNSPPVDPLRVLEFGQPDLVINKRVDEASSQHMARSQGWSLLYQDGLAQIWGRQSRFDDRDSIDYLAPEQRSISDSIPRGYVDWPALPASSTAPPNRKPPTEIALAPKLR